jgi:hypothetical protein
MATSRKKVIVRLHDQTVHAGYLPASDLLRHATRTVELLDPAGRIHSIPLSAIRLIAFVRDFNLDDPRAPERLLRTTFLARPRTEGLWVRLTFTDSEVLEGLATLDLSLLDDILKDEGIYLIPPDVRSNTQRLFIPRAAISTLTLLGVITNPSKSATKLPASIPELPFPEV